MQDTAGSHAAVALASAQEPAVQACTDGGDDREPPESFKCQGCGAPIAADTNFCGHCGKQATCLSIRCKPVKASESNGSHQRTSAVCFTFKVTLGTRLQETIDGTCNSNELIDVSAVGKHAIRHCTPSYHIKSLRRRCADASNASFPTLPRSLILPRLMHVQSPCSITPFVRSLFGGNANVTKAVDHDHRTKC